MYLLTYLLTNDRVAIDRTPAPGGSSCCCSFSVALSVTYFTNRFYYRTIDFSLLPRNVIRLQIKKTHCDTDKYTSLWQLASTLQSHNLRAPVCLSSPKWPIMCRVGSYILHTHSLFAFCFVCSRNTTERICITSDKYNVSRMPLQRLRSSTWGDI